MKKLEWTRDTLSSWPGSEYAQLKEKAGWRLSAIEWQREAESGTRSPLSDSRLGEEIPYGTRIAGDCLHLEENPSEIEVLNRLAEMIVQDLVVPFRFAPVAVHGIAKSFRRRELKMHGLAREGAESRGDEQ